MYSSGNELLLKLAKAADIQENLMGNRLPSDPQKSAIQESFPSNPDLLRFASSCSSFAMSSFFPIVKTAVTSTLPGLKRESYFFEITGRSLDINE